MTKQLLAFSRKKTTVPQSLNLNRVLTDYIEFLRPLVGEHIRMMTQLDPLAGNIRIDQGELEQIIMNLATNARDAMPEGGTLLFRTEICEIEEFESQSDRRLAPGTYAALVVQDNGHGIQNENLQHISEPFFTTKDVDQGTGLGLATVYGFARQSGGDVRVESQVGFGTSFTVLLPRTTADLRTARVIQEVTPSRGTERVLLVEDEQSLREATAEYLREYGYQVLTATDGMEALSLVKDAGQPPDILVSDVVMPKLSGGQLASRLRVLYPALPVILISGYAPEALSGSGSYPRDATFLQKPFPLGKLAENIKRLARRPSPLVAAQAGTV